MAELAATVNLHSLKDGRGNIEFEQAAQKLIDKVNGLGLNLVNAPTSENIIELIFNDQDVIDALDEQGIVWDSLITNRIMFNQKQNLKDDSTLISLDDFGNVYLARNLTVDDLKYYLQNGHVHFNGIQTRFTDDGKFITQESDFIKEVVTNQLTELSDNGMIGDELSSYNEYNKFFSALLILKKARRSRKLNLTGYNQDLLAYIIAKNNVREINQAMAIYREIYPGLTALEKANGDFARLQPANQLANIKVNDDVNTAKVAPYVYNKNPIYKEGNGIILSDFDYNKKVFQIATKTTYEEGKFRKIQEDKTMDQLCNL